jgi:uncharacterized protein YndB with AHSA1/START domain
MIEIEILFTVERPVHLVFERISNIAAYPQWVPNKSGFFVENRITSEGPFGLGTTYMDKLKWGGRAYGEITRYEPPSNIRFEQKTAFGVSVFYSTVEYVLRPLQAGTEIVHRFEATGCGAFSLFDRLLSKILRPERERTCSAIKHTLESEPIKAG